MRALYIETSAVLRWLLNQEGGDVIEQCLVADEPLVTSTLTTIEVERCLRRAVSLNELPPGAAEALQEAYNQTLQHWTRMRITPAVEKQASKSFPVEPIRTLDAIHLATATIFLAAYPDIRVVSFDSRVRDNAKALGFPLCP